MGGAELIRIFHDAFNRRDIEAMIALQHPEIEFVPITANLEGEVYRTAGQIRAYLRSVPLDWDVFESRAEVFYEKGEQALALGTWVAKGRGSGVTLTAQPAAWHVIVRDGLVYRWHAYSDTAKAIEAFGVDEQNLPALQVQPVGR
jgi:ketosteroid isomerase-like protein